MKPLASCNALGVLLALAFSSAALAAPPPAPHLTVAANDIKQLEFAWEPVPGAQSYELWFRALPGAQWVKYREQSAQRAPLFRIGVSVHFLDWQQARYYIRACNVGGCTASNVVGVNPERFAAIGFIKPALASPVRYFGAEVAASADGTTIAVLGTEGPDATPFASIHVYRKTTTSGGWRLEARLRPNGYRSGGVGGSYGDPLAISADGSLIAWASWAEPNAAGGLSAGAVYLLRRTGTTWALSQKISSALSFDYLGHLVKVDDAGTLLAVTRARVADDNVPGTLEIYRDAPNDGSDQFVHERSIPVPADAASCASIALSGDGNTLMRGCSTPEYRTFTQVLNGPGFSESARLPGGSADGIDTSYDGTVAIVQGDGPAIAWRLESTGWKSEGFLTNIDGLNGSNRYVALSRDGKFAAIGNAREYSIGQGPLYPPYTVGDELMGTGGVIVHERKPGGWVVRRLVKPDTANRGWAGDAIALADNGKLLVVGAPVDPSAAKGLDGDRDDDSAPNRGAVWVY